MVRVPDAVQRFFGAAPQSRDRFVAKETGPGSAARREVRQDARKRANGTASGARDEPSKIK
jgi:hypothetical protein